MSFSIKKSSFLLLSSIFASSSLLVACGGGGSSDHSTPSPNQPTTPTQPTTPIEPTTPTQPTEPTTPTQPNSDILAETSTLPALPVNSLPLSLTGDLDSVNALKEGVYTTQLVTVMVMGGGAVDCPSGGSVACPSITKYQSNAEGKIEVSTWAYMPNTKQWIELRANSSEFNNVFKNGDIYTDGNQWSTTGVDFSEIPSVSANNILNFSFGSSTISLSGISKTVTPSASSVMGGVGYSADAKSITYQVGLTKGQYISLDETGFWKKTDDGSVYSSLAKFRAAHIQKENPVCLIVDSWDKGLIFNPSQTGATVYKIGGGCENQIDTTIAAVNLTEGVKTISGKQVIYLSQSSTTTSMTKNTSESQFLWALGLSEKGIPAQGKAYQAGYITKVDGDFYNKAAVLEWLIAKHGYTTTLAMPN